MTPKQANGPVAPARSRGLPPVLLASLGLLLFPHRLGRKHHPLRTNQWFRPTDASTTFEVYLDQVKLQAAGLPQLGDWSRKVDSA